VEDARSTFAPRNDAPLDRWVLGEIDMKHLEIAVCWPSVIALKKSESRRGVRYSMDAASGQSASEASPDEILQRALGDVSMQLARRRAGT
jgi:hypothetical protein